MSKGLIILLIVVFVDGILGHYWFCRWHRKKLNDDEWCNEVTCGELLDMVKK